jgi:hypothetical protein
MSGRHRGLRGKRYSPPAPVPRRQARGADGTAGNGTTGTALLVTALPVTALLVTALPVTALLVTALLVTALLVTALLVTALPVTALLVTALPVTALLVTALPVTALLVTALLVTALLVTALLVTALLVTALLVTGPLRTASPGETRPPPATAARVAGRARRTASVPGARPPGDSDAAPPAVQAPAVAPGLVGALRQAGAAIHSPEARGRETPCQPFRKPRTSLSL